MRAEAVVGHLLASNASLVTRIGTADKVFGGVADDGTDTGPDPEFVVYLHANSNAQFAQRAQHPNTWLSQVEVLGVSSSYQGLKELMELVRLALVFQSGSIAGVYVNSIVLASKGRDLFDEELSEWGQVFTFNVTHQE